MRIATDPMHQFKIEKLFDLKLGGLDVSFTTSALWMVIGVLLVIGVLAFYVAYLMADELLRQASRMARAERSDHERSSLS